MSLQLAELKLKYKNLEELLNTLRDGKGAAKVIEWHKRIDEIRLEDLKLKRNITKLHEQIKFSENLNKSQEHSLVRLEEENVRMAKVSRICSLYCIVKYAVAAGKYAVGLPRWSENHRFSHLNKLAIAEIGDMR